MRTASETKLFAIGLMKLGGNQLISENLACKSNSVFPIYHKFLSVSYGMPVAVGALDVSTCTSWEIMYKFRTM